ncbi:MAG: universal stress protein [Saprospiraceae bacterium]
MKKILVPTDFSDNADNALRYAINIGNYFEAEIQLLHTYDVKSTTGSFKSVREYIKEDVERDLSDNLRKFKTSILGRTKLQGRGIEGNPIDVICSLATHEKFDLIVMGTQGANGLKGIFLGSNTSGVMKKTTTPLLAVPNNFKYRPIKDIIFPVDSGIIADEDVLKIFLEIATAYKSKIKVVHLETEKVVAGYDPGIEYFLKRIPHSFHRISGSRAVNEVINDFVYENNSDMLCMIRRERHFWENLFHKSVTTKEIFDSPVPLLILHSQV